MDSVLLADAYEATFAVAGMECLKCAAQVQNALALMVGVHAVEVSLSDALVSVAYEPRRVCLHLIRNAISRAGRGSGYRFRSSLICVGPYPITRRRRQRRNWKRGS